MTRYEVDHWNGDLDAWETCAIFYTHLDAELFIEAKILRHYGRGNDYRIREVD